MALGLSRPHSAPWWWLRRRCLLRRRVPRLQVHCEHAKLLVHTTSKSLEDHRRLLTHQLHDWKVYASHGRLLGS